MADELMSFPRTEAVLKQLAEEVRTAYIKNLVKDGHFTYFGSDRLVDTITTQVTVDGQSFTASLRMNKYWEYLEYGTGPERGRGQYWPPSSAIARWIEVKPVIPRPSTKTGRIPTPQQLVYYIKKKIHDEGTKGSGGFARAREEILPTYEERIREALTADIGDYLWMILLR